MSEIVSTGKAHYWGTSEWTAEQVSGAMGIAEKHGLHKPVTEQSQYNLLERRIDTEFARLTGETGFGRHDLEPARFGACSPASTATASPRIWALDGYEWLGEE